VKQQGLHATVPATLPVGQINPSSAPDPRRQAPKNPLRAETNFTSRFNVIWVVQITRQK
jgi:hypothetical protein